MSAPESPAPWKPDDAISQRAADYFQRRRFWEWSAADQAELDTWLAESALHEVAYLRVQGIIAHTEELAALNPAKFGRGRKGIFIDRRFIVPILIAASVAIIAALGFPFVSSLMRPADRIDSTDVGGRTLLSFTDHTEIELNTNTVIRFRMTTAERTVWLDKGEAWFRVAHDAAHPFTVIAGKHRITDLGTEFSVRRDADSVDVALVSGRAALSAAGVQTATLTPGDEAVATPLSLSVTRLTPRELADKLAWRRGMLVFHNTKLADVVREFNRYNTTKLVIVDPGIANEPFSAELKTDDSEAFLNLAKALLNLRADREGNDILISRVSELSKKAVHAHGRAGVP